jgi:1-deoxy-D-xylulose-5-phosphate reductoisomerase
MATKVERLDLLAVARLDFEAPDEQRFPALRLARDALKQGGAAPIVLNAGNEIAVAAFLDRRIHFPDIARTVGTLLDTMNAPAPCSIADVIDLDRRARSLAGQRVLELAA